MAGLPEKIIIDSNSLINFFNHYYFDRDNDGVIYNELMSFFIDKVKSGEIVIVDKVFNEFISLNKHGEVDIIKKEIKKFVINTLYLAGDVDKLKHNYYIASNERYYHNNFGKVDYVRIDRVLDLFSTKHADLYLVAYCNAEKSNINPILLTDESFKGDNKLIEKIPTICKKEKIEYMDTPDSLFNYYKDELIFTLNE